MKRGAPPLGGGEVMLKVPVVGASLQVGGQCIFRIFLWKLPFMESLIAKVFLLGLLSCVKGRRVLNNWWRDILRFLSWFYQWLCDETSE